MATSVLNSPLGMFGSTPRSALLAEAAALMFDQLGPLHGLALDDGELLRRSATGVGFIHTMGSYSVLEHELFELALADLAPRDASLVEAAACLAVDRVALAGDDSRPMTAEGHRRLLWLAGVLRLADAIVGDGGGSIDGMYAAWTADVLYLEIDGARRPVEMLERVRSRSAALEAAAGRRLVLTSSAARRSPVRTPAA